MTSSIQARRAGQRGFTLVELLVVIAIIAVLAGLLLPALGKARHRVLGARCLSNERQIGFGLAMYLPDNAERLPFSRTGFPNIAFVDFYAMLNPYLPTNGMFYRCPTDKGPMNMLWATAFNVPTNRLPGPASYWYQPGLSHLSKPDSYTPRQYTSAAVRHPARKIFASCLAVSGKKDINGIFLNPQAHARDGWNLLFGDGHAGLVALRKLRRDPQAYLGALDWSSPGWADVD